MTSAERTRLSILLPVRNEGINLRVMLRMLRGMVEVPHEVIVVYDRADDDSVPVVDALRPAYPNLRGVLNTIGPGVVNAIRAGVENAKGDFGRGEVRLRLLHYAP